jgi:hypothetical protein
MSMNVCERKRAQRSREDGYQKSRQTDWKARGIVNASYTEYLEKIVAQKSACAICNASIDERSPLDHSHATGVARGVLCNRCNLFLGRCDDDSAFFRSAAMYLEKYAR